MIKNRTEPIPEKAVCDNCKEEHPYLDTIQTWHRGRLCMGCYIKDEER